jgi:hypothetical protein
MKMVIRGGHSFDPYPQLQPAEPLFRDDRDDVGQALLARDAPFLDEHKPKQAGLTQRVLHNGPAATRERGDRIDMQGADPGALTLPSDHAENGELAHREGGGDLRRDDSAHGLTPAAFERGLTIWRARAFGGPRKPKGWPEWLKSQDKLAEASKVGAATVGDFEREARTPRDHILADIRSTLESAGVEFTNGDQPGVRLRNG